MRDPSGKTYYYFATVLGSTRAVTSAAGTKCFDADEHPLGPVNDYNTSCSPTYEFTFQKAVPYFEVAFSKGSAEEICGQG